MPVYFSRDPRDEPLTRQQRVDAHRATLVEFTRAGGPLSPDSPYCTQAQHTLHGQYTRDRRQLHNRILNDFFASTTAAREGKAIIMSGPPGAGKSAALRERIGSGEQWRVIDPDYFKSRILFHETERDPTLSSLNQDSRLQERRREGELFAPGEYAALIHEESSDLARRAMRRALVDRENVVIDGIHSQASKIEDKLSKLREFNYSSTSILVVDGTQEVTRARVEQRWRNGYERFLDSTGSLDGRFVPEAITAALYSGPQAKTSSCYKAVIEIISSETGQSIVEQIEVYIVPRADANPVLYRTFTRSDGRFKATEHTSYATLNASTQEELN